MKRRRTLLGRLTAVFLVAGTLVGAGLSAIPSAGGVTILDSTWREEGGRPGKEWKGFGAAIALAAQPQFAAVVALVSGDEYDDEAYGSGTWIGNDDKGRAYVLSAAHVFELPARTDEYQVRLPDGSRIQVDRVWIHPHWDGDLETRAAFDLVILRLAQPIKSLGPPPLLYDGADEAGRLLTFMGFGMRGTGSSGEDERYHRGSDKAAAQGIVDDFALLAPSLLRNEDNGNHLGVALVREDGSIANPLGGANRPANRLAGLLGEGDSGGSAWIELGGRWVIAGVNSSGDGVAGYGDTSWFTRVSPHKDWIAGIFPNARFLGDDPAFAATASTDAALSKRPAAASPEGQTIGDWKVDLSPDCSIEASWEGDGGSEQGLVLAYTEQGAVIVIGFMDTNAPYRDDEVLRVHLEAGAWTWSGEGAAFDRYGAAVAVPASSAAIKALRSAHEISIELPDKPDIYSGVWQIDDLGKALMALDTCRPTSN